MVIPTGKKIVNRPGIAYEGSDLEPPPANPVPWIAKTNDGKKQTIVMSQTWFRARQLAMIELRVGPEELTLNMVPENEQELNTQKSEDLQSSPSFTARNKKKKKR